MAFWVTFLRLYSHFYFSFKASDTSHLRKFHRILFSAQHNQGQILIIFTQNTQKNYMSKRRSTRNTEHVLRRWAHKAVWWNSRSHLRLWPCGQSSMIAVCGAQFLCSWFGGIYAAHEKFENLPTKHSEDFWISSKSKSTFKLQLSSSSTETFILSVYSLTLCIYSNCAAEHFPLQRQATLNLAIAASAKDVATSSEALKLS